MDYNTQASAGSTNKIFKLSIFRNKSDNKPRAVKMTWRKFVERLANPKIRADKDGVLFSPASFQPARRANKNVTELSMLVLDYDHKASLATDLSPWLNLRVCFAAYTSHSHLRCTDYNPEGEERFRVVIPLAHPIPANQFPALWSWACQMSNVKIDSSAKDTSRMFYAPAKASPDAPYDHRIVDGPLLDWRALELDKLPIQQNAPAKGIGANGCTPEGKRELNKRIARILNAGDRQRNVALNREAYWLGHSVARGEVPEAVAIENLQRAARIIGLDEGEIMPTINSGLYDGIANEQGKAGASEDKGKNEPASATPAQKKERKRKIKHPLYQVDKTGVHAIDKETGEVKWLSGELWIEAITRSIRDDAYGLVLTFRNLDGKEKTWVMPRSWLTGDRSRYRERLLDMGFTMASGQEQAGLFHAYLNDEIPTERAWSVDRVGWADGAFVFPDLESTIGTDDGKRMYLQATSGANHLLEKAGTLDDWRANIGHYCISNSRLVFAVSAAFAASLLTPFGIEGGGFHFMGRSGKGKSTTQYVAGSVWGGDGGKNGFVQSWNATPTGMEYLFEYHNDGLLCLDEIGEANPQDIGRIVYALTNGRGKNRGAKEGGLRRKSLWTVLALSSGEKTLAQYMGEADQKIEEGQEVRLLHIPSLISDELGLFEDRHGFKGGQDFSEYLMSASRTYYGTPIRAFLDRLINQKLIASTRQRFESFREDFIRENHTNKADPLTGRAAKRFAIVGFAGQLASEWGITGWPVDESKTAAARMFKEWMAFRGQHSASAQDAGIRKVVEFLERHGSSRFQSMNGERVINRAGFKLHDGKGEVTEYCFLREVFRNEVCAGFDYREVLKSLKSGGCLPEGDGQNLAVKRRVPELGDDRFYAVKNSIFRLLHSENSENSETRHLTPCTPNT